MLRLRPRKQLPVIMGKRRSPSYARRQERRKLLKKKTGSFPEDPRESSQTEPDISNNLSLDLNPCPDRCLLGYGENSERESDSDDPGIGEPGSETRLGKVSKKETVFLGYLSQMWVGGVADFQTRFKPLKTPPDHPENRLFRPKFHLLFSQILQKPWGWWVGKQIWERFPKKNNVFFIPSLT